MNKRQTEVEKAKLAAEAQELKHLKGIYNKAAEDIAKNISITDGKIEVMLQEWDSLSDDDKSVYQSKIYQKNFQKQLQKQINEVLKDLNSGQYKSIDEYLKKCYETGFVGTMYDIAGQGIPIITPIDQKKVITAMKTNSKISSGLYTKLGEDVEYLQKRIANNISRGIATSDSYENIARNIANASNVGMNNAMRIARTEGHRIHSNSAHDAQLAAKDAGADIVKQWDSTMDGNTRTTHRLLDGQIREVEEPFEMGGMKAMYPSDFGRPEEDINCRCALLQRATWALDDDELETLKEKAKFHEIYVENDSKETFRKQKDIDLNTFTQRYLKATTTTTKTAVAAPSIKGVSGTVNGKSVKVVEQPATGKVLDFTTAENEALEWYVSGDGMWINQYLRGKGDFGTLSDNEQELLKLLTSATDRQLPDGITKLYRSVDAEAVFGNIDSSDWDNLYEYIKYGADSFGKGAYADGIRSKAEAILNKTKGKTITEKGFMSTTKKYDVASEWGDFSGSEKPIVLELDVPKGIKGADLKKFDIEGDEQFEVLLARNTKYKIKDITVKDGQVYIKAEIEAAEKVASKATKTSSKGVINSSGSKTQVTTASDSKVFDGLISKQTGMNVDYKKTLKGKYAKGKPTAKKVYNKYVPSDSVADANLKGHAHFNRATQKVNMDYAKDLQNPRGAGTTYFHEHGHYIDFVAAGTGNQQYLSTNSQTFGALLKSDFDSYVRKVNKAKGYKHKTSAYADISFEIMGHEKHSVSDIIGGLTKGKCQGSYGHKKSYWNNVGAVEREAFAHMYEAMFDKEKYKLMEKYFPKAFKEFRNMLKGLV